jgi:hypothetical protein
MTMRKKTLLLAGATLLGGLLGWRGTEADTGRSKRAHASGGIARTTPRVPETARVAPLVSAAVPSAEPAPTRSEAAALVKALYRKEQLTRELDLEQLRYGRHYWESECNGPELAKLQQAREAMLRELNAEANRVLHDLYPGEAGEAIALAAIFDVERAGPNLTFLSPELRARFEAEIFAHDGDADRRVDRERCQEIAQRVLPTGEMDLFRRWNEQPAAALRNQLVGFSPTENEFVAILSDTRLTEEDRLTSGVVLRLETLLGAERFAEFLRLKDPAMRTALHDLQRLGLPLAGAEWLATTRTRAIADIAEIWRSPALPDAIKQQRVAQLERVFGEAIAAKLGLPESSLDGIDRGS